ncbi:MAG: FkbW, partial [uncultured Corynebacteriales bacterium]
GAAFDPAHGGRGARPGHGPGGPGRRGRLPRPGPGARPRRRAPGAVLPGRPDHRRDRAGGPDGAGRLRRPHRRRHGQPDRGAGHPGRRLLPGHLHRQHPPRLEPRLAVRAAAARAVERRPGDHRGARGAPAVRQRPGDLRLRAGQGLRVRRHRQGQHRRHLPPGRPHARRRGGRVEPPGHPADRGRQGRDPAPVRLAPAPHVRDRPVQRRLPGPLAAGERAVALRRRARLGGHPVPRRGAEPADVPADGAAGVPPVRRRRPDRPGRADRGRLLARLGAAVGLPPPGLLGPHPADLPGGVRPGLGRRPGGGHPVLRLRHPELRRRLRLLDPAAGPGGDGQGPADRPDRQADDHPARHPGHAAAPGDRLRRLRPADRRPRPLPPAPLSRGGGRQPRRRPVRPAAVGHPADPALLPRRLRGAGGMGGPRGGAGARPDTAPAGRRRREHLL